MHATLFYWVFKEPIVLCSLQWTNEPVIRQVSVLTDIYSPILSKQCRVFIQPVYSSARTKPHNHKMRFVPYNEQLYLLLFLKIKAKV